MGAGAIAEVRSRGTGGINVEQNEKQALVAESIALLGALADTCVITEDYAGLPEAADLVGARLEALTQAEVLPLGLVVITPGAAEVITAEYCRRILGCHRRGVWGDLDPEDREANDAAVLYGNRVISAWVVGEGVRVWVITEADRSSTTILLPEEY